MHDTRVNPQLVSSFFPRSSCSTNVRTFFLLSTEDLLRIFERPMDQRQLYGMHSYWYPGSGTQEPKGSEFFTGYQPYRPPERSESYETQSMIDSLAHTHNGNRTEGRSLGEEVPNPQRGLQFTQPYKSYSATSPEVLDKQYAYSGNMSPQGNPNGYGSANWTFQRQIQLRTREGGISDVMQSERESILQTGPRYSYSISPYGSNTDWRPSETVEHLSASFDSASNFSYPASSSIFANCGNYPHVDGNPVYQPDQRDVSFSSDWKQFLLPTEENYFLSNQQLPTQETSISAAYNGCLGALNSEQSKSGFSVRMSAAVNSPDNTMTVHAYNNSANDGHKKKRKKKPRTVKPRKPRTLTVAGKAHAKAVREYPGGACEDCKRKKTKARDPPVTYSVSTHS